MLHLAVEFSAVFDQTPCLTWRRRGETGRHQFAQLIVRRWESISQFQA
jgi:hypothetical protein